MEDKKMKLLQTVSYVIMGLSALIGILYFMGALGEDIMFVWAYILLTIIVLLAVITPIIQFIKYPKNAKTALIGIGAFAVLFGISYLLASSDITGTIYQDFEVTVGSAKGIGALMICTYLLGIMAIVAILLSSILNVIKK